MAILRRSRQQNPALYFVPNEVASGRNFVSRPLLEEQLKRYLTSPADQVAITGESGVGKTSLLRHVAAQQGLVFANIRCYADTSLAKILGKFEPKHLAQSDQAQNAQVGVGSASAGISNTRTFTYAEREFPEALLSLARRDNVGVIALENFHKVQDQRVKVAVMEALETFTDERGPKLFVLGVADSLGGLLLNEADAGGRRRVREVSVPRMSYDEIETIYENGFSALGIQCSPDRLFDFTFLADGFPYFAHDLGLKVSEGVVKRGRREISEEVVDEALERIARESGATEYERFTKKAAEQVGNIRPRKLLLVMLALDDSKAWKTSDVARLWPLHHPDIDRRAATLTNDLNKLTEPEFGALLRRRKLSNNQNEYYFSSPETRVYLRVIASTYAGQVFLREDL